MSLQKIKNSTFRRIGDSFGHYFDPDHFLGQTSIDGTQTKKDSKNHKSLIKQKKKLSK
jgi:hypothetical protein